MTLTDHELTLLAEQHYQAPTLDLLRAVEARVLDRLHAKRIECRDCRIRLRAVDVVHAHDHHDVDVFGGDADAIRACHRSMNALREAIR